MACLGAIEQLGWPLDRIVTAEVWATDTIPADLPPMMEFKKKADAIIKERWGIEVEHLYATRNGTKLTYEKLFYHIPKRRVKKGFENGSFSGFPYQKGAWCNDRLKTKSLDSVANTIDGFQRHGGVRRNQPAQNRSGSEVCSDSQSSEAHGAPGDSNRVFSASSVAQGADRNIVQYLGIAADEPKRFHNLTEYKKSPLVELGWTEADCRKWCEENDLLSPIYESSNRGGCWFCHNQGVGELRKLRHDYPELWALLLKWDNDSPVSFKPPTGTMPNGITVHDFDKRFQMEDEGVVSQAERWKWEYLQGDVQLKMY